MLPPVRSINCRRRLDEMSGRPNSFIHSKQTLRARSHSASHSALVGGQYSAGEFAAAAGGSALSGRGVDALGWREGQLIPSQFHVGKFGLGFSQSGVGVDGGSESGKSGVDGGVFTHRVKAPLVVHFQSRPSGSALLSGFDPA